MDCRGLARRDQHVGPLVHSCLPFSVVLPDEFSKRWATTSLSASNWRDVQARRTGATYRRDVQAILRHSKVSSTLDLYVHSYDEDLRAAVGTLGKVTA
jgi:hypothetical protein